MMEGHPLGEGGNRILPTGTRKQEENMFIQDFEEKVNSSLEKETPSLSKFLLTMGMDMSNLR